MIFQYVNVKLVFCCGDYDDASKEMD